jgi:hypothetical protein
MYVNIYEKNLSINFFVNVMVIQSSVLIVILRQMSQMPMPWNSLIMFIHDL